MQDVTIPGWIISLIAPGLLAWLVWLTMQTFKNQQKIEVNTANDINVRSELIKINDSIKEFKSELNARFDTFLANEIDLLKEALKK